MRLADSFKLGIGPDEAYVGGRPSTNQASKLKVSRGSPLLEVTRITYDDTGQPLHLLRRLVNPQRVHITDQRLPITSP
ncbi:UTRA domain-containing protein [Nonomuraea sp. NPDC049152]|uniref:UTRA domain-containing protein n=1 Tax=Nonomuraea sp. NPDC049152 TaxID=3154350 RepID=UPI0033DE0CBB